MKDFQIRQMLGGEYAQLDRNFHRYAIVRDDLLRSLSDKDRSCIIINAPRGSGKSGLLITHSDAVRLSSPTRNIVVTRYWMDVKYPDKLVTLEQAIGFWRRQLLEWMMIEIGTRIDLPKTEDEVIAVEFAERAKRKSKLPSAKPSVVDLDTIPDEALVAIIEEAPFEFWLLLDEMDDHFSTDTRTTNRIAGLLEACKVRAQMPNVYIRLAIRPHVMTYLRTRFDHIQQLRSSEMSLTWKTKQLKQILAKRINFFEERNGLQQFDLIEENPELDDPKGVTKAIARYFGDFDMKFADTHVSDYRAFHTVSLGRPRWMLEFCALALEQAAGTFAGNPEFKKAMHIFGSNRIQFLAGEHRTLVPELEAIVNGLAGERTIVFHSSRKLEKAIQHHILGLSEEQLLKPDRASIERSLEIAQVLFMLEIIRARQGDKRNYRLITYVERPSLLASWNTEPNIRWEIHPTFQRALNLVDNQTYRVGADIRTFGERVDSTDDD